MWAAEGEGKEDVRIGLLIVGKRPNVPAVFAASRGRIQSCRIFLVCAMERFSLFKLLQIETHCSLSNVNVWFFHLHFGKLS